MNITDQLSSHITPILAIAGYVAYPKELRINPSLLYTLSVIHNGLLVAFSGWAFISLSQIIYTDGIVFQSNYYFQNPHFDRVIYWFYISKYYEFFDTFLLYLNGKSPIFLQKYHHIGAVICWHLHYVYKVDCLWIPSIANSFVHTIMYSYYLGCLLKVNQVRFIKKYITSLQLAQLFIPNFICLYYYVPPVETTFNYNLIKIFVGYVSILVILFSQFYYKNYIEPKRE
uniref:Very-long-chain 3-oxoacyl-CoA synthase n=1 Tax=viral metagenome TaxID=1070528 RepID=A0A6C0B667_9ZZZZ